MVRWNLELIKQYCKEHNVVFLSKSYTNGKNIYQFQCECGNIFNRSWDDFYYNKRHHCGCKSGYRKWTIDTVKEKCLELGTEFLSKEYKSNEDKYNFKCSCGEIYTARWADILSGNTISKCERCRGRINWNYDKVKLFIEKESNSGCKLIGNEYINNQSKLKIQCLCGEIFETTFMKFKDRNKRQCNKCSKRERWHYNKILKTINKYSNCKLLNKPNEKFSANTKLLLECCCGTVFTTDIKHFIYDNKRECYECKLKKSRSGGRLFYNEIKNYIENDSGSECKLLTTEDEYINTQQKLKLQCKCGNIFYRSYNVFSRGCFECRSCTRKASKGEMAILEFLKENNINYKTEYWFENLKGDTNKPLQFDFAILDEQNNLIMLIEYDGQQHFETVNFGGISESRALKNFKTTLKHDEMKNQYCKNKNIKLLRIPYWEFDNIETILKKELNIG